LERYTTPGGLSALSACELAELVRTRKVSPVDIVDDLLARLEMIEPTLNAFVALDREGAKSAARAAEAAVMRRDALGALHGVPVTIKDIQAVAGLPTRRGSRLSDPSPAAADAAALYRSHRPATGRTDRADPVPAAPGLCQPQRS